MHEFKLSNFTLKKQEQAEKGLKNIAYAQLGMGGVMVGLSPFFAAWLLMAGLLTAGIIGGVRLVGHTLRPQYKGYTARALKLRSARNYASHAHGRRSRTPRRRQVFTRNEGDSGSDECDPDIPGSGFSLFTPSNLLRYSKNNSIKLLCNGVFCAPLIVDVYNKISQEMAA